MFLVQIGFWNRVARVKRIKLYYEDDLTPRVRGREEDLPPVEEQEKKNNGLFLSYLVLHAFSLTITILFFFGTTDDDSIGPLYYIHLNLI